MVARLAALALLPAAVSLLTACSSEHALRRHEQVDAWYQHDISSVDILFVVDDSNSMAEEQQALADGFASFIELVDDAAVDFHLGVVNTDLDEPGSARMIGDPPFLTADDDYVRLFQERALVGTQGSDQERGLQAAVEALSTDLLATDHEGFLRDEAQLLTVFVSDEDDCSDFGALDGMEGTDCYYEEQELVDTETLLAKLVASKSDRSQVSTAGILGLEGSSCDDAYPGRRYLDVVRATGGLTGDICSSDWSGILFELGLNTVGEQSRFPLTELARAESLSVYVDDELAPDEDWTYDEADNAVVFDDDAIPPRGSTVRAEYIVAPSSMSSTE